MKWDTSKKLISKKVLSKKAKQLLSKMLPVEGNVFQPIAYNRPNDTSNTNNNPVNDQTETKNIYLRPFKRIASVLKLSKTDKTRRDSTAWTGGDQRGGNSGSDPSPALPDNNHGHSHHLPTTISHTSSSINSEVQTKVTFHFLEFFECSTFKYFHMSFNIFWIFQIITSHVMSKLNSPKCFTIFDWVQMDYASNIRTLLI